MDLTSLIIAELKCGKEIFLHNILYIVFLVGIINKYS